MPHAVYDTPPDPRGPLLAAVNGNKCDLAKGTVVVPVTVGGQTKNYTLAPDRANVMSYFMSCPGFDHHLSKGQLAQARKALLSGNRTELLAGGSKCYASGWKPGPLPTELEQLAQHIRKIALCKLLYTEPLRIALSRPPAPISRDV